MFAVSPRQKSFAFCLEGEYRNKTT